MEPEKLAILNGLDSRVDIIKRDLLRRLGQLRAAGPPGYLDQPGVPQLRQNIPNNDRVDLDASRQKITRNLIVFPENIHRSKYM